MQPLVLTRQKILLTIVDEAGGQASRLQLMKLLFLAGRECGSCAAGYYEFLPYQYGPYSFAVQHEVGKLVDQGLLQEEGNNWQITRLGRETARTLSARGRAEAAALVLHYASRSVSSLVDHVYATYPDFTVNSKRRERRARARASAKPAVYTIGYEGRSVDGLLETLVRVGVRRLVDVRANPVARRFGFHRSTLQRLCGKLDIGYAHVPELGISSTQRATLPGMDNREELLNLYDTDVLPGAQGAVAELAAAMRDQPTAIMCMEADPATCHRSRLARQLASQTRLDIRHIR